MHALLSLSLLFMLNFCYAYDPVKLKLVVSGEPFPFTKACNYLDGSGDMVWLDQPGRGRVFRRSTGTFIDTLIDISPYGGLNLTNPNLASGAQTGLLGCAFNPKRKSEFYTFYNAYSNLEGYDNLATISRWQLDPNNRNKVAINSEVVLEQIPMPTDRHNGGAITFMNDGANNCGKDDDYLYVGIGDGIKPIETNPDFINSPQNWSEYRGSILRLDVNSISADSEKQYSIPRSNPFGNLNLAKGVRQPTYCSVKNCNLWCGDVGENKWEEINKIKGDNKGDAADYGWKILEGPDCVVPGCTPPNDYVSPVAYYPHVNSLTESEKINGTSIIWGFFYQGDKLDGLRDDAILGDLGFDTTGAFSGGKFFRLRKNNDGDWVIKNLKLSNPEAFTGRALIALAEDVDHEIWVSALNVFTNPPTAEIWKLK